MRFVLVLAGLVGCGVDARVCNDTGKDMTGLSWANVEQSPLKAGSCSDYQDRDDGVCSMTNVEFTIDAVAYANYRIDCYDRSIDDGLWTIHLTILDESRHAAGVHMVHD